jgi:uncharacterized protein YcbX
MSTPYGINEMLAYPVAGGGAVPVDSAYEILQIDRKYVIVDSSKPNIRMFQNDDPRLAVIRPEFKDGKLILSTSPEFKDPELFGRCEIPLNGFSPEIHILERLKGSAYKEKRTFEARRSRDPKVNAWLEELLGGPGYSLMRIERTNNGGNPSRFDMNNSFHLVNKRSLELLNEGISNSDSPANVVPLDRFRGNFVIDGDPEKLDPEELRWKVVGLEGFSFEVKPTVRCVYTQTDQNSGELMKAVNPQPLKFLQASENRESWNSSFGVYLMLQTAGGAEFSAIKVGSEIDVKE